MAGALHIPALPLCLVKGGRKSKADLAAEKAAWERALYEAKAADLVILGTPTQFRKPHPSVVKFLDEARPDQVAIFCTYYGMLGATLIDLEAISRQRGARFVGTLALRVGTERYRFRRNVSLYADVVTDAHIAQAGQFARNFVHPVEQVELRSRGVCGKDCRAWAKYRAHQCEGAGVRCWSGRQCRVFDCCVLRRSLETCDRCPERSACVVCAKTLHIPGK